MERIDIFYIATNIYTTYFKQFLDTLPNFFPNVEKMVHVISDGLVPYHGYFNDESKISVSVKNQVHLPYPLMSLTKTYYVEALAPREAKCIFYFDADTVFVKKSDEYWRDLEFAIENGKTLMAIQPGELLFRDYEIAKFSSAYIPDGCEYYPIIGSFFGGSAKSVLELCRQMNNKIRKDLTYHINGGQQHYIPPFFDQDYFIKTVWDNDGIDFDLRRFIYVPWLDKEMDTNSFMIQKYNVHKKNEVKNSFNMKKVIGIFTYYLGENEPEWDCDSLNMGGSETWTIYIADELQKMGYHVIVFGNPSYWCFSPTGVEYVPRGLFADRCEYQHFDYFISSRTAYELSPNINCSNFFIMSHECVINCANTYYDLKPNLIKKVFCLSDWHKDAIIGNYPGLAPEMVALTFNGVDESLYADVDMSKKRNMMVWSSCKERGLKYFIDAIYPCVKRMVPDFELVVCAYNNDVPQEWRVYNDIRILGRLSKQELADLQKEAKIWAYLNYGDDEETGFRCHETFCISAIENGFAKNAIICSNATGLNTTLSGYSGFVGTDLDLSLENTNVETRNALKDEVVDRIIEVLTNDELCASLAEESYEICKKYTWKNAADNILKNMGAR